MQKKYTSLGLMSGTSGDGVDASIICSNGIDHFEVLKNKYFEYDSRIYNSFHSLKEKIFNISDLEKFKNEIGELEREITLYHAKIIKEFDNKEDFVVGFHGQTIYHNSKEKISRQLGDAKLLSVIGFWFGWVSIPFVIFFSSAVALLIVIPDVIRKKKNLSSQIPFGPYLIVGCIIFLVFNEQIKLFLN